MDSATAKSRKMMNIARFWGILAGFIVLGSTVFLSRTPRPRPGPNPEPDSGQIGEGPQNPPSSKGKGGSLWIEFELSGAGTETLESQVVTKFEESPSGLQGVREISSVSRPGRATVWLTLDPGRDADEACREIGARFDGMKWQFPVGTRLARLKAATGEPILWITLSPSGPRTRGYVAQLAHRSIRPRLLEAAGVSDILAIGARGAALTVWLDPERMASAHLAMNGVLEAIAKSAPRSVEDLAPYVVATRGGAPVRLRDIANVTDGPPVADARAVRLGVLCRPGCDEHEVASAVRGKVEELRREPACQAVEFGILEGRTHATPPALHARLIGRERTEFLPQARGFLDKARKAIGGGEVVCPDLVETLELRFVPDEKTAIDLGVSLDSLRTAAVLLSREGRVFRFRARDGDLDVHVCVPREADAGRIPVENKTGAPISLGRVGQVDKEARMNKLVRWDRYPCVTLVAKPAGDQSLGSLRARMEAMAADLFPLGYRLQFIESSPFDAE